MHRLAISGPLERSWPTPVSLLLADHLPTIWAVRYTLSQVQLELVERDPPLPGVTAVSVPRAQGQPGTSQRNPLRGTCTHNHSPTKQ